MICPTYNGSMTQYVGFNEREPKPGTPFECVKGCATPTLQKSAQQTQSQPATSAKAQTPPAQQIQGLDAWVPLTAPKGTGYTGLPDPDPDTSSLRTHQPQGGSHPAGLDRTTQQRAEIVAHVMAGLISKDEGMALLQGMPKLGYGRSNGTVDSHSPDQTSAPATDPSCPPKAWTSD